MSLSFQEKIAQLQANYYKSNNKNTFFKSSQKLDCATTITNSFELKQLFEHAIYIIPNTNRIYFNYPFFKTFANPTIFEEFVSYAYQLFNEAICHYSNYEMHVNWNTYSVSAHDRYKELYRIFLERYEQHDCNFHDNLTQLYLYFTPNVIQLISKLMTPLMHPAILNKITLFNKTESEGFVQTLLHKK